MVGPDSSRLLRERILVASIALIAIFLIGTFGFYAMGQFYLGKYAWDVGECAYMTVITITTVGFGELPHLARVPFGRAFTVGVLLAGLGVAAYFVSALTTFFIEGEFTKVVTDGGHFGGYGLYLVKGRPVFTYNLLGMERTRWQAPAALQPGKHTVAFTFTYDGPGPGKGGTGVLSVDGQEVARQQMTHSTPFLMNLGETFDIGSDTRTGVDERDYQVPFAFTGKIDQVSVKLGPPQLEKAPQQSASATP